MKNIFIIFFLIKNIFINNIYLLEMFSQQILFMKIFFIWFLMICFSWKIFLMKSIFHNFSFLMKVIFHINSFLWKWLFIFFLFLWKWFSYYDYYVYLWKSFFINFAPQPSLRGSWFVTRKHILDAGPFIHLKPHFDSRNAWSLTRCSPHSSCRWCWKRWDWSSLYSSLSAPSPSSFSFSNLHQHHLLSLSHLG